MLFTRVLCRKIDKEVDKWKMATVAPDGGMDEVEYIIRVGRMHVAKIAPLI